MLDDPQYSMMKTQTLMMSTLAPISTPRRRYHNHTNSQLSKRKSVLSRTINMQQAHMAAAFSKEHRIQLKTTNLPEIKKEKQVILQEWLNQALQSESDAVTKQPLKTIRKYGLDKATLRNMQLSHQSINKLYKGLFVYTSGMKNAFQEMLVEAQGMPRQDNILPKMYFKAFMKLFQNIVPIKSCFQLIQNDYLKNNAQLKKNIVDLKVLLATQKQEAEVIERKLKKQIEELLNKITAMMTDYTIMQSTLHLYQQSFAQEVSLRLKFEEKINQTYSSYEQLKTKYDWIRQQLDQNRQQLAQNHIAYKQSADKITSLTVHNDELMGQIKNLKQKLIERQTELDVKNQQVLDIRLMNHTEQERKQAEENAISDLLAEINSQKRQKVQIQSKYETKIKQNGDNLKRIEKLKQDLSSAREKNDEVYIKYHEATLKIIPVQKQIHAKDITISSLQRQLNLTKSKNNMLEHQIEENQILLKQLKTDIQNKGKDLNIANKQVQKQSQNIIEMKAVKDKYERINQKFQEEMKMLKLQNQAKIKLLAEEKEQNSELKFKADSLQKKVLQLQIKMNVTDKDLQEKEEIIQNMKHQQEMRGVGLETKLKQKQKQLQAKQIAYRRVMDELGTKQSDKYKKLEQISFLKKQNQNMQIELKEKQQKLDDNTIAIQKRDIEIDQLKKQLENREFTLNKRKSDVESQIFNLKKVISNLKEKIQSKEQYFHPMVVEDLNQQLARSYAKINKIMSENQQMRSNYESLQKQLKNKRDQARYGAVEVTNLKKSIESSNKELVVAKQQIRINQVQFQKRMQERQKELKKEQHQLKVQKEQMNDFLRLKQNQLNLKEDRLYKIQSQLKTLRQNAKHKKQVKHSEKEQQTDPQIALQNTKLHTGSQVGIQTDNLTTSNGKKLTTSDRLRQRKGLLSEEEHTIKDKELKMAQLHQVQQQQKQVKEVQRHKWHSSDRRIDDKQYVAALKFTYMRN